MPDTQLPSNVAQIIAVLVECTFYGIYLVTFAASLRSIVSFRPELSWASQFRHQRPVLIVVLLLFIFSTLNLALGFLRIRAYIHHDVVGSGAVQQLGQDWVNILKVRLYIIRFHLLLNIPSPYVLTSRRWLQTAC